MTPTWVLRVSRVLDEEAHETDKGVDLVVNVIAVAIRLLARHVGADSLHLHAHFRAATNEPTQKPQSKFDNRNDRKCTF